MITVYQATGTHPRLRIIAISDLSFLKFRVKFEQACTHIEYGAFLDLVSV